jgi:6-phosphogluconolactonase
LLLFTLSVAAQKESYLLIGTYTGGKSEGIYVYKFNTATADNSFVSVAKSSNPSFLTVSPNKKFVYAVNENADSTRFTVGGNISAFSFNDSNGILTEINKQPSGGKHPCYVSIDKTGSWLFAGNYSSGSIGVLHANANGSLDSLHQTIQHEGSGPDKARQQGPHVHSTFLTPDNKYLLVPDLGIDKVMVYSFDKNKGVLEYTSAAVSTPGNGPRHLSFSRDNKFVYLVEEMSGSVVCYKLNNGHLQFEQRIVALPADFKGVVGAADIHVSPNGNFLYCSNRGDANSITIFSIDKTNGHLAVTGQQSTMGKTPRNFNFDPSGNFLLVANQNSDDIFIFKMDQQTGLLTYTGKKIEVPNPVCIEWVK